MSLDLSLYLVIGPQDCDHDIEKMYHIIQEACGEKNQKPGISLLQYRNKSTLTRDNLAQMAQHVRKIKKICAPFHIPVLVNDHLPVALASDADGLHVGQSDQSIIDVYYQFKSTKPEKILGLTVKNALHLQHAPAPFIDYFGMGAVFATQSKKNPEPPIGIAGLAQLQQQNKQSHNLPAVAIAGINEKNCTDVMKTGVDGVAVISAICRADSPGLMSQKLRYLTTCPQQIPQRGSEKQ